MTTSLVEQVGKVYAKKEAQCFLIHGEGLTDYLMHMGQPVILERYLQTMFERNRIVVFYDVARGFRFPLGDEQKAEFMRRAGIDQAPQGNAALAGLSSSGQGEAELPSSPTEALELIDRAIHYPVPVYDSGEFKGRRKDKTIAAIIYNLDAIATTAPFAQMPAPERANVIRLNQWGQDFEGITTVSGAIVIATADNLTAVNEQVTGVSARWATVRLGIPTEEERFEYTNYLATPPIDSKGNPIKDDNGQPIPPKLIFGEGFTIGNFVRATAMLKRIHIEDITLHANREPVTVDMVREHKARIIAQEYKEALKIVEPRWGFNAIAGKSPIKSWMTRNIIKPISNGNRQRAAKGVLLMGPPGTGKTVLAEALAYELGMNLIIFDPSKIYSMWQGVTEQNLAKTLEAIEVMGGIILIDEAEGEFPDRDNPRNASGDGGTRQRVMATMMAFMSDKKHRGRVVWVVNSNYPNKLDKAMIRPGRIDANIPVLLPDVEERVHLLKLGLTGHDLTDEDYYNAALSLNGYTGAEIAEGVVIKAIALAQDEADDEDWETAKVNMGYLQTAIKKVRRSTGGVETMTNIALEMVTDYDLLSEEWQAVLFNSVDKSRAVMTSPDRFTPTENEL
jgi:AAA+ superfamily predicted ATPase